MKNFLLFVLAALLFTSPVFAQNTVPPASDVFQLGTRKVRIPAPEGFTEIFTRYDRIAARMIATEDAGNEALTSHVPTSTLPQLDQNPDSDLSFYTKVSISKRAKTTDLTLEEFAGLVAYMEKNMGVFTDPKLIKRVESGAGKGLSDLWGDQTSVKINEPKNLGVFDKGERVFSTMMFANLELGGRKFSLLGTTSFVNVNQRLIYVYTYKINPTKDDIASLRSFAKNWTTAIIAVNK